MVRLTEVRPTLEDAKGLLERNGRHAVLLPIEAKERRGDWGRLDKTHLRRNLDARVSRAASRFGEDGRFARRPFVGFGRDRLR